LTTIRTACLAIRFILFSAAAAGVLAVVPARAYAQDALTRARSLYESAEYEQALLVLSGLNETSNPEAAAYRAFCLIALDRQDEARGVVQALVRRDPWFRPADSDVSPRVRTFFDDVRRPLLPEVARAAYVRAKTTYDQRDFATARDEFTRVVALLDELGVSDEGALDLRTLASAFRDLADTSLKRSILPAAAARPAVSPPATYSDADAGITRPVSLSRPMPAWAPNAVERHITFTGAIEVLVSEDGRVLAASMVKPVHPRYDAALLDAAKSWTFKPAIKDGVPVRYRYRLQIRLEKV
jgi:TonB family protein